MVAWNQRERSGRVRITISALTALVLGVGGLSPASGAEPRAKRLIYTNSPSEAVVVAPASVEDAVVDGDLEPASDTVESATYPIDLATALRLAGASNLQIAIASERVAEAAARSLGADALWAPSLRAGLGYNHHDGRIQDTRGDVIEVSRESLFVGAGAGIAGAPLNAGSGGPPRLFVDLSLADAIFERLSARRLLQAQQSEASATFNDVLLEVTLAFLDLSQAHARAIAARNDVADASRLVETTEDFLQAQRVPRSDVARAKALLAVHQRRVIEAEEDAIIASAELVRLIRLEPTTALQPNPAEPVPITMCEPSIPLEALLAQSVLNRPEMARNQALVQATMAKYKQEKWRPWLPNLSLGYGGGGFGGGRDDRFDSFAGRSDIDAIAVWELRNLGLGNRALKRQARSRHRQAHLASEQWRDRIGAEVSASYRLLERRLLRMSVAERNIAEATESLKLNLDRIQGGEGLPLEVVQAIQSLAGAREAYIQAVFDQNRAQFALVRAIGNPIDVDEAAGPDVELSSQDGVASTP